jgi:hypothetical protein
MPVFRSDEVLWYNPPGSIWGRLGYACPNFGDDPATLNNSIAYLVQVIGRNLSAVMHHGDADLRRPPSVNTLIRVHKLITRARSILAGRAVPPGQPRMEPVHATPAPEVFLIFPVPYFKVRNAWMKEWCGLALNALGELMQHTDNRVEFEIGLECAGLVSQYLQRIYVRMATELLQVPLAEASKPDFLLQEQVFAAYDPAKWFTSSELIDTVSPLDLVPTEDDLRVLTDGIPATQLVGLGRYPSGLDVQARADDLGSVGSPAVGPASAASPGQPAAPAFVPPPGP